MTLQKVPVSINLTDGIDTKTDEKVSVKLSLMENCTHEGKGTPKKRKGIDSLPKDIEGGGTITEGIYSFGYGEQSLISTNDGIYVFIDSLQQWRKLSGAKLSGLSAENINGVSQEGLLVAGTVKTATEQAYIGSLGASENVYIQDLQSNVIKKTNGTLGRDGKLVQLNDEIITIAWKGGVSNDLTLFNHTTGTIVDVVTDTSGRFDVISDGSFLYVCYNSNANTVRVKKLNGDGTIALTQTYALGGDTLKSGSNPSILFKDGVFHITFIINRGSPLWCRYFSIDNSLNVSTAQLDVFEFTNSGVDPLSSITIGDTGETLTGPDSLYFFYSSKNSSEFGVVEMSLFNFLSLGIPTRAEIEISSKAFTHGGKPLVLVKQILSQNINWLLLDSLGNPQGMINNFDGTPENSTTINAVNSISLDYELAYIDDGKYLKKASLDFNYSSVGDFVEFGDSTFLAGSLPLRYNGYEILESQFLARPEISNIQTTGGALPADTYDYKAIYEYTEPNGNILRSEDSVQYQFVSAGVDGLQVTVKSLKVSYIDDTKIKIVLYRKLAGETVFRRIDSFAYNDRNLDTINIIDNDTDLDGNEALYTTGTLLSNQTMPAIKAYGFHNNRLFGIIAEDANRILFSKKWVIGEGVFFNNFQTINVEDNQNRRADRLSALGSMDNKLMLFKNNTILAVFGDGPDATGANGEFSEPELITTDVGCIEPRSLVTTGQGLLFKSQKGIYILTRKLSAEYIGAPAEAYNSLTISGAVLMDDINQVRWVTSDGIALVYDYFYQQWSIFTNFESSSCFIHRGKMAILKADGSFLIEHNGNTDDGNFVKQKVSSSWLKISGVQEFQRVYRMLILGEYKNKHKITVNVYYDYHDYIEDTYLLTPEDTNFEPSLKPSQADIENGLNDGTYQYNIHLKRQKCQAIRVEIEDKQSGIAGESYQLTNLTFVAGAKKGAFKTRDRIAY